ncbi:flagellar export chaperone FlgN [Leifsonia sp. TF02-11]|uniref:flagellar export chaperone FlgN n=1 Tax=Leifsonia sp. TF02-11 TaxID=2815212 RepID=UPI001AA1ADE6|nr:flagellar export chaperone FlgN [Leifsonia sp. TF02-11]MBN9631035.1 flagellar export chaperone FlgN [Actinomycetota bacterium]MBO1737839.1 flagellar export chaperone FlgN [Leifsonia sp. TF02-11]
MAASELSAQLWKERELLELLLFKLEEEQLLLIAGKSRWISHATREVEQVMERMRDAALARTIEVSVVAEQWGLSPEATLRELAAGAPDGIWSDIFASHLTAMTELTGQIADVRDTNERLLREAARSTQETLNGLSGSGPDAGVYGAAGESRTGDAGGRLFDTEA